MHCSTAGDGSASPFRLRVQHKLNVYLAVSIRSPVLCTKNCLKPAGDLSDKPDYATRDAPERK